MRLFLFKVLCFSEMRKSHARKDDAELEIDPVYHGLSRINGEINRMSKPRLQQLLLKNGLNDRYNSSSLLSSRYFLSYVLKIVMSRSDKLFYLVPWQWRF